MITLELNTETVGLTLATYGVGMASGAMEAGALLRVINFGYAILLGPIMSVLAMVFMVATLQRPSPTPRHCSIFCLVLALLCGPSRPPRYIRQSRQKHSLDGSNRSYS